MTLKLLLCAALGLVAISPLSAQPAEPLPVADREIFLFEGLPPGTEHWDLEERTIFNTDVQLEFVQNVVRPSLLYFAPDPARVNGTAVIIAPGGGGVNLTIRYEGTRVAQQLARAGVAAFILKYRLVAHPTDSPMSKAYKRDDDGVVLEGPQKGQSVRAMNMIDGEKAVAWVRTHAAEFGCRPDRIGFVGFSAGGIIACYVAAGPAETRPDFFAPIYGVRAMVPTADSPPVFLASASDDTWATDASVKLFEAWRTASRPAELHVFQTGGHGFLIKGGGGDHVLDRLEEWMQANGWLEVSNQKPVGGHAKLP